MCFSSLFLACSATSIRLLVTPANAETTTTTLSFLAFLETRSTTWHMFSPVATLVPPNFITIFIFRTPSYYLAFDLLTYVLCPRGLLKLRWLFQFRLRLFR